MTPELIAAVAPALGVVVLLNLAGLGYIAYFVVTRGLKIVESIAGDTRATVEGNSRAVNRIVRMWALYLVTERRDIPEHVRAEARAVLRETEAERAERESPGRASEE